MGVKELPKIVCVQCWLSQIDRGQGNCLHCYQPLVRKEADESKKQGQQGIQTSGK